MYDITMVKFAENIEKIDGLSKEKFIKILNNIKNDDEFRKKQKHQVVVDIESQRRWL